MDSSSVAAMSEVINQLSLIRRAIDMWSLSFVVFALCFLLFFILKDCRDEK